MLGAGNSALEVTGYTVNDGNGGNDYTVTTHTASGTITPRGLDIYATTDSQGLRRHDRARRRRPTVGTLYSSDTVTGLSQAFVSRHVLGAGNSTLVVTGYTVNDGNGGDDYTVTTHTASGTITPRGLDINAVSDTKVYDGTHDSSQTPTVGTLYSTDTVTGLSQAFVSRTSGRGHSTLVVTGYTVNDGNAGNDYTVTTHTATGTITPARDWTSTRPRTARSTTARRARPRRRPWARCTTATRSRVCRRRSIAERRRGREHAVGDGVHGQRRQQR